MAIKIDLKIEKVEFEINGETYATTRSDDKLVDVLGLQDKANEEIANLELKGSEELAVLRGYIIEGIDKLFGEGVFNKIEQSLSDGKESYTMDMAYIFFQIVEEFNKQVRKSSNKYLPEQ